MEKPKLPEVWLRGPLPGLSSRLQPVAHALLEAKEEIQEITEGFPSSLLWVKPAGAASVGFHLQHIKGVIDRLFTYARGMSLSTEQLRALKSEGQQSEDDISTEMLVQQLNSQIDLALHELTEIAPDTLSEKRNVGRAQLPSTTLGLIFHAAEHTMRHVGQLLVTVKVLRSDENGGFRVEG